jgi:hypothetical protein
MRKGVRKLGRLLFVLAMAVPVGAVAVSCANGGGPLGSVFLGDGGRDGSLGADAELPPPGDDGTPTVVMDVGSPCMPKSCKDLGYNCGPNGDQCGGMLQCGNCPAFQKCGYGGYSVCGSIFASFDGGGDGGKSPFCTPTTCAALGYNCGPAGDGCGGLLQCGTCTSPQFCGGGGRPSVCGGDNGQTPDGSVICNPKKCADWGFNCGPAGDGCGGSLQCGTCTSPEFCGGGGQPSVCGGNNGHRADGSVACTPVNCAFWGFNCGPAGDGCGGALQCGSCVGPDICGGGGVPGVCGNSTCVNLCTKRPQCDGGVQTSVSGTVLAGASAWTGLTPDPVPNVLVYIPNAPLQTFAPGAACRRCGADVSGSPLVSTYSNFDGTFTLNNVPAGTSIPIVIQLGRWRRQFTFNIPACASTSVGSLHMPRNQSEGDIPLTAISTGNLDPLECVLLKMGVDQAEFTPDSGTGRIHVYGGGPLDITGLRGPGSTAGAATRQEPALLDTGGTFMNYDQILLPCWGNPNTPKTAAELANLISYADSGGHFFATHYSYLWLVGNGEFNNVAQWHPDYYNPYPTVVTWTLNVSTAVPPQPPAPYAGTFAKWLNYVGALSNSGATLPPNPQVSITNPRHDADAVAGGSVDWIDGTDPVNNNALVQHFTFNTPVGASTQCGHAIFSDFHVADIASAPNGVVFPAECTTTFTAQEKVLEFMVWDLSSCVGPPTPPTCTPRNCAQQNIGCGPAGDGCGNPLDCGPCAPPLTCGGGGVPGQCGMPDAGCPPRTCAQQNIGCGPAGDGCGKAIDCGPCTPPLTCGGGGVPGQCGAPDAGMCTPRTCAQQNIGCGPAGDGCGMAIDCGPCAPPFTCGGGGVPFQCGAMESGSCTPLTCMALNLSCGPAGDGCGNALDCGQCTSPSTCGGGGVPGQCGGTTK